MEDDPTIPIATSSAINVKLLHRETVHPSLVKLAQKFARSRMPQSAMVGIAFQIVFAYLQLHPKEITNTMRK